MYTITNKNFYYMFSIIIAHSGRMGKSIKDVTSINVFSERINSQTFMDGVGFCPITSKAYKHSYAKKWAFE
jgi:hypothetical protein